MKPFVSSSELRHSEAQHLSEWGPEYQDRLFDESDDYASNICETTYTKPGKSHPDPWTYVACNRQFPLAHKDAIVIAVKGACRGNGQANPRGSIGVYLHEGSRLNRAIQFDDADTSQRADLLAAIRGLRVAYYVRTRYIWEMGPPGPWRKLRRVVIKTNSKYVVDAMTFWMEKWEANGFRNAKGKAVVNEELFRNLESLVRKLEKLEVCVQFWHVDKERNREAYLLANAALDGVSKREALEGIDHDADAMLSLVHQKMKLLTLIPDGSDTSDLDQDGVLI